MNVSSDDPIFYVLVVTAGSANVQRVDATDLITAFEYEDSEKKADKLTLTVDNWDLSNFDNPIWKPGNSLYVTWGYNGRVTPERQCVIQKVTGATELKVEAQSKSVVMNREVRSALYENTRRSEIVHAIAKQYGYGDNARFIEDTEEVYESIVQARATDAQFIKRLADLEGFEFYVDFEGFHWHPRRMGQQPHRVLQWFLPPAVGDILGFSVENDIFAKPKKVTTKGRDPLGKKDINGEGSDSATERDALRPAEPPGILDSIASAFTGAATAQPTPATEKPQAGPEEGGAPYRQVLDEADATETTEWIENAPTTETSDNQAKKEAGGKFKRAAQTTVKLDIDLVGDPFIFAKTVLDIRGISKRLSGLYYVNEVKHTIGSGGYSLKIKCSTDGTGGGPANGNVLQLETDKKTKAKPSKANVNDQKPKEDGGMLDYRENLDPATGKTEVDYFDLGGKPGADK